MTVARPAPRWVPALCAVVAFAIRAGTLVAHHALRGIVDYDDSVYLAASQHLLAGRLPYRDFVFLHPPGVAYLLLPFAALGHVVGDSWTLAAARLLFAAVGAANAALVAVLLRRYGTPAALAGGLLYAGWLATIGAETTIMLEPLLNLGLLLTLVLLRRVESSRAYLGVGLIAGAAVAVKVWALADVVVVVILLAITAGWRRATAWLGGAAVAAVVLIAPLALTVPARSWRYLVSDQLDRARDDRTTVDRLRYFDGVGGRRHVDLVPAAALVIIGLLVVVGLGSVVVVAIARRRQRIGGSDEPVWWALLAAANLGVLAGGPSFYYHYAAFAAAPLCLVAGYGVSCLVSLRPAGSRTSLVAVFVVITLAAVAGFLRPGVEHVDRSALARFAAQHRCVWAPDFQLLELSDSATRSIAHDCPMWVDEFGTALDELSGDHVDIAATAMTADEQYQRDVRRQLAGSDALILPGGPTALPWSTATRAFAQSRFRYLRSLGRDELYLRR